MGAYMNGTGGRGRIANLNTLVQPETQEFLRFITSLVLLSKGMQIDLTVAEVGVDSEEFRKEFKRKLELVRRVGRRPKRSDGGETG